MIPSSQLWIAAGIMLAAGFYMAERRRYEIVSAVDALSFVAMPAWFFELGNQAQEPVPRRLFGTLLILWLGAVLVVRWNLGRRFSVLAHGVPSFSAGLLGFAVGSVGLTIPDALREPIAFPARAAFPILALVAGWGLNRVTKRISLGRVPLIGRQPLGTKVVVLFLIIGLLPLGIMTLLNEQTGRRHVEDQQFSTLLTYSISVSDQLDNRLDSYQKDAFQLAQDPRVVHLLQTHATREDPAAADALAALGTFLQSDNTYLLAFVLNANGWVQLSTNPDLYNRPDLSFREYYRQAIAGRPYISDISIGVNVPKPPALFLAHPVRDSNGTPIGVVALRVDAEKGIWSLLGRSRIGANRTAILVDTDGVVIGIDPDNPLLDSMIYHSLAPLQPEILQRLETNKSFGPYHVTSLGLDPLAAALAAPTGKVEFRLNGRQDVAGFGHLSKKPWAVVVFSDLETFLQPVHAASLQVIGVASMLGLVLALVALILARNITEPLDALARSALNVARGDLRQKLPTGSQDEIGKLTEAFNNMIANLDRAQAELVERANEQAALAQENARLYEQEREVVQELKRLNDLKTDFVSTVSHELRTPLTVITGFIQTLRRRDVVISDTDRDECLAEMDAASRRLNAMVADLLQVSSIDAGRLQLQVEPTPVTVLWDQLAREFASVKHPCEVVFRTDPGLPTVMGDRLRLEQVLRNLIGNAIKYSPRGGRVEVKAEARGETVQFSVRDQGIGMTPEEVGQLFNKFYRGGSVLTRKTQGTGLGLYISKSIVEGHGGQIWVESAQGAGSTFFFTLPLAPATALRSIA